MGHETGGKDLAQPTRASTALTHGAKSCGAWRLHQRILKLAPTSAQKSGWYRDVTMPLLLKAGVEHHIAWG